MTDARELAEHADEAERQAGKFRGRELASSGKRRRQWRTLREMAETQARLWDDLADLEARISYLEEKSNRHGAGPEGNGEPPRGGTLER